MTLYGAYHHTTSLPIVTSGVRTIDVHVCLVCVAIHRGCVCSNISLISGKMLLMSISLFIGCILSGAYEPPKAARSVQLRIIAQNGVCIYSST